jgi:hypothetical protein
MALRKTLTNRPDLIDRARLGRDDLRMIEELQREIEQETTGAS